MENNVIEISNFELLGRIIDSEATYIEHMSVLLNISDSVFEECFMVALQAISLFNEKTCDYESIQ